MNIIVGHEQMDLDCLGSMALAQLLHPGCKPVKSRITHPLAMNVYNVYKDRLVFMPYHVYKENAAQVETFIGVDARKARRFREFFEPIQEGPQEIIVYDHHNAETLDIPHAKLFAFDAASNTSGMALLAKEKGLTLTPEQATIALTGIYADTGSFSHLGVKQPDFEAAAWLMSQQADLTLVKRFLKPPIGNDFEAAVKHVLEVSEKKQISGYAALAFFIELPKQVSGLSAIADRVFQIEEPDVMLGFFALKENRQTLVIGRSKTANIDVRQLLEPLGGGGHAMSASATVKNRLDAGLQEELLAKLQQAVLPALTAAEIMDPHALLLSQSSPIAQAGELLRQTKQSGAIVIDDEGRLAGSFTLRNLNLAQKNNKLHVPVRGCMDVKVPWAEPASPVSEVESIFFAKAIGRLPILDKDRKVLGVITRENYLNFLIQSSKKGS